MDLCTRRVRGAVAAAAVSVGAVLAASAQPETRPATPPRPATPAAQPEKPGAPAMDPKMQERMEQAMNPGAQHKVLEAFVGEWTGEVKFWMEPGGSPMESKGTVTREWTLGNRFIQEEVDAASDMGPFKGLGFIGYNTLDNRYESFWIEDHATHMTMGTGKYDEKTKTFTFQSERPDFATGKRTKDRHVIDISDPRRHVMTGYCTGPDGKEYKNFEGVFEKAK